MILCFLFSSVLNAKQNRTKHIEIQKTKLRSTHLISMYISLKYLQILIWVLILIPIIEVFSSPVIRSSEIKLMCGSRKDNNSLHVSTAFVPNFIKVMESIQRQLYVKSWGHSAVMFIMPKIYGLAQCHSDLSPLDCKLCFSQGRVKLPRCIPQSAARVYLDGCFLRYDTYNFLNESVDPKYDTVNCSQPAGLLADTTVHPEFTQIVSHAIKNVTDKALKNGTFATVEAKRGVVPVFALAQCWSTLAYDQCRNCLVQAGSKLSKCAPGGQGQALYTGCYMRYSTNKFFHSTTQRKLKGTQSETATGIVGAIFLVVTAFVVLASLGAFIGYQKLSKSKGKQDLANLRHYSSKSNLNFKYEVLEKATNYFSEEMKLGQGGAGSVYKGNLPDGRIVAVKRLVYNTRQWVDQFFNEVNLISGIQHKNLVRLLGCSIEGPESLLVYEYVPNKSLDQILFGIHTVHILSWQQRYDIILGTAQGLAYLHGGSGVKIVHRDIKTSNVLLDEKLIPKIADFGLARCFAADNTHISTGIAGTLGYMAPEYLIRGQLTEKADVYGFGVFVLEVATGKKNSVYSQGSSSILHCVWKHHKANNIIQAIDPRLSDKAPRRQAEIALQIGLLCTQASASLRPTMSEIIQMLTNKVREIPQPKQPPFLNASVLSADDITENSITKVTLTRTVSMNMNGQIVARASTDTQSSYVTTDTQSSYVTASSEWSCPSLEHTEPR